MGLATEPLQGASLEDLDWIEGDWQGQVNGEPVQELWLPRKSGQRMGCFRWSRSGEPWLYEFLLMGEYQHRLQIRLKHFRPDCSTWEEKGDWTEFTLTELRGTRAVFLQTNKTPSAWLVYERQQDRLMAWFEREHEAAPDKGKFEYVLCH